VTELAAHVAAALARLAPDATRAVVAVSGGPDSVTLLEVLVATRAVHGVDLVVANVDHGIHPESGAVAAQVADRAARHRLPCRVVRLALGTEASETEARTARRAALRSLATELGAEVIVVAHHADDQAETVLMRLLRGSGPAGLAGMAARHGPWVRPMLAVSRAEIARWLADRGETAWDDPANVDPRHLRSWLRGEILPRVAERLPDVRGRLREAGRQAAGDRAGWAAALEHLPGLALAVEPGRISVAAPPVRGYPSALRHAVLTALGRRAGVPLGRRRLAAIDRLLGQDHGVIRVAPAVQAELARGRLALVKDVGPPADPVPLPDAGRLEVGGVGFVVSPGVAGPIERRGWATTLDGTPMVVRGWQAGDRIRPLGGTGHRLVATLLKEAGVPSTRRRTWPVVTTADGATIVWVPGICRATAHEPLTEAEARRVECDLA
jgi:tRNA(Ile)-lysidine synthetase-like protein